MKRGGRDRPSNTPCFLTRELSSARGTKLRGRLENQRFPDNSFHNHEALPSPGIALPELGRDGWVAPEGRAGASAWVLVSGQPNRPMLGKARGRVCPSVFLLRRGGKHFAGQRFLLSSAVRVGRIRQGSKPLCQQTQPTVQRARMRPARVRWARVEGAMGEGAACDGAPGSAASRAPASPSPDSRTPSGMCFPGPGHLTSLWSCRSAPPARGGLPRGPWGASQDRCGSAERTSPADGSDILCCSKTFAVFPHTFFFLAKGGKKIIIPTLHAD